MGRVRDRMEEERRRREEEVRAFRAALEKISPRGHVDSEGRMKSGEVPSATEGASLQAAGSAAGQSKEKREKEAMTASFFARSDEERRREEEKGRWLWQLIEQLRKDSQARAGAFGLTDKQASKVHSAYKQGVKDYNLQSEQYRQLIGEANRQVFERGVAYVEQGKEDEKQQQAQIKQAYEKYLPLSEERKASNARREKALTELPQKVIGYMQKEMRKGKDEKYLQEQVMKDVREEGYRGLNALYEAGVRMAQGRENLDQWRHNALMEKEKLLFENPNNEDLIGKEDYEQRVAQGAQFNKFVQGGTDTENIAYGEGWQKSYLTDGSKYLRPEEIDRLSYYLSFSDDPMKKREAQDYYEYLENLGQRRYEYYRFLSGETAKRGGEYGDAFISGGMEDSMQGIVSFLFEKPLSILTDRIAPTHVDTAEQMRYAQDLANETDPIKKLNKQVLQAVGAQVPYMLLGGLTPKMYAGSNIGFKAGKEATEEWAKINAKDLVRMSQAGYYGSMAASIYGNAEQQALLEGKNPQQAATYALLNTMAEVGLQAVVGRVAGIAGGAMMQHSPLAQSFVNRIAKNPIAQRVTVTLLRTGGENVEEALQMALQPALVNMAYGTNEKLNITKEEAGELAYITTGATLLMNVFSLGLNLKNDIVTIRRDLRLPDNTLLSAEIQNKILLANAVDAPLERVLTKGEMAQVQAFAQNMTTEAFAELIEEAKRVAAFRFGNKTYAQILQEIQGKPFYEKLQVLSHAIIEYIDEKRQTESNMETKTNAISNPSASYKFTDVYKNAVNKIKGLLSSEFTPHQKQMIVVFEKAIPKTVELVKQELGIDISDYRHTMDQYSIQHAQNKHSNDTIPLKKEDFLMIPDVLAAPDNVYYGGKTRQGLDAIVYEKVIGDRLIYVEEVRTGRKNMHMTTAYWQFVSKNKKAAGANLQAEPTGTSRALPRHRNSFENSITEKDANVNIQSRSEGDRNSTTQDEKVLQEDEQGSIMSSTPSVLKNDVPDTNKKPIFYNINIHGVIDSEIDEYDPISKTIYEYKSALNLYMENPDFPQTEEDWAQKQIFERGKNRIEALQQDKFTLSGENVEGLTTTELSAIRNFVYRIDADTPGLRRAVQEQLEELKKIFPEYNFSAEFGGEK